VIGQNACDVKTWETANMSGPIVRKYGFPNFDKIFGERPLEHGVEEAEQTVEDPGKEGSTPRPKKASPKKKSTGPKKS
jgi:hypothetical protein